MSVLLQMPNPLIGFPFSSNHAWISFKLHKSQDKVWEENPFSICRESYKHTARADTTVGQQLIPWHHRREWISPPLVKQSSFLLVHFFSYCAWIDTKNDSAFIKKDIHNRKPLSKESNYPSHRTVRYWQLRFGNFEMRPYRYYYWKK